MSASRPKFGEQMAYRPVCLVVTPSHERVPVPSVRKIRIRSTNVLRVYVVAYGRVVRVVHEYGRRSDHILIVSCIKT